MHVGSTLVVVADGAVGRFLIRERPGARLVELMELRMDADEANQEPDTSLCTHDRLGGSQRKIEHRMPARESKKESFLAHVLRRAIDVFRAEKSASLVLCAPSTALAALRGEMPADLREHLALSLGRDMTKATLTTIDTRLRKLHV